MIALRDRILAKAKLPEFFISSGAPIDLPVYRFTENDQGTLHPNLRKATADPSLRHCGGSLWKTPILFVLPVDNPLGLAAQHTSVQRLPFVGFGVEAELLADSCAGVHTHRCALFLRHAHHAQHRCGERG